MMVDDNFKILEDREIAEVAKHVVACVECAEVRYAEGGKRIEPYTKFTICKEAYQIRRTFDFLFDAIIPSGGYDGDDDARNSYFEYDSKTMVLPVRAVAEARESTKNMG